jgi:hypothetical protein
MEPVPAPPGAVVLFDGTSLAAWRRRRDGGPARWPVLPDGSTRPRGGDIVTVERFADFRLHVEFLIPPSSRWLPGQWRGNSGVYLQGRYEVQILDSCGLRRLPGDRDCGALYRVAPPRINACRPAGEWQSYDVLFRAPAGDGTPARATVWQNGVRIHDAAEVRRPTGGGLGGRPDEPGPVLLQDHGCPVRFRNIWIVPRGEKSWEEFSARP